MSVAFTCDCGTYTVPTILEVSEIDNCLVCNRTINDSAKLEWLFRYLANKEARND